MKKILYSTLVTGVIITGAMAGDTTADIPNTTGDFQVSLDAGYHTKYIFRGVDLGDDLVDASFTLGKTCPLTGLELEAGAWYGRILDRPVSNVQGELNLFASATKDLGFAKASVGYVFYHNFKDADDAQEVYLGLSKEVYGFNTSIKYFWDIETDNQGYTEFAISKSFNSPMTCCGTFDASLTAGYLVEEGAFSHLTAKVSKTFKFSDVEVTPYLSYTVELDDLEVYSGKAEQNEFFAGVGVSYSF